MWTVIAAVMWAGSIVSAFLAGRAIGQVDDQPHIEFLRRRVSTLSDRLDKLEAK